MEHLKLKATSETIEFINDKNELLEMIIAEPVMEKGPPVHKHARQTEIFKVMEGTAGILSGDETVVLQRGESFTVPANTWHTYFGVDKKPMKLKVTLKPALSMKYFISETNHAANRRKSESPSMFDRWYLIAEMKGQYFEKGTPLILQKTILSLFARLAKKLGWVKVKSRNDYKDQN
jgi:mannose-6-phosphate isomerase-like protein (cupin superfamily)